MAEHHVALSEQIGVQRSCALLGLPRATHYRRRSPVIVNRPPAPRPTPPNALSAEERQAVLDLVHEPEHCDLAVAQIWTRALDEGNYLCSQSTMHRILRAYGESRDRRDQRTHSAKKIPELMAECPNTVWSWDITKLKGPAKGINYNLYVVLDIFSRYVLNWIVAEHEDQDLAKDFLSDAIVTQGIDEHQLTIHADRGGAMRSKPVSQLMQDLHIRRSHSRPHVSNDNPFSEAQFKTLKYCPSFPGRFDSIEQARAFCHVFFAHYNHEHRHSGIALHTPASVHYGTHHEVRAQRQETLDAAFDKFPLRFRRRAPRAPQLVDVVWINKPAEEEVAQIS